MDAWIDIRRKARECHQRALAKAKGDRRAAAIVAAALDNDDLQVRRMAFAPGILGSLDRSSRLINVAENQEPQDELVTIAHEIGHFHLHLDPHNEVTVRPSSLGGDPVDSGAGRVEGYSPRERKEVQADIFSGEFLCPSDWLRDEYVVHGKRPEAIAAEIGLPHSLVLNQMIRALLLPPLRPAPAAALSIGHDLDDSQRTAALWDKGPLLVDAGPGTGKTRTLIKRIEHLLQKGSRPGSFLALTFSKKAAEEMRERLSAVHAGAAVEMWVGTFHAFGLELVTKWPLSVGRTASVSVLDQVGSLALLEANLDKLPLNYYQNLYEPAYELVPVLRMISRCKDELVTPDMYRAAADADFAAAGSDAEKREAAERAQELAGIYRVYEQALADEDAVDFGDLIRLALQLARTNPEVKNYLAGFKHILVDEFQDVNFASAEFLRAICEANRDVWVVADQRQSIYRFRGAEPSNVQNFAVAFGGQRHALTTNYRSHGPVVRAFESFSQSMGSGTAAGKWNANRNEGGGVSLTVTPSVAAESEAIHARIEELRRKGLSYADQAILARSHLTLARITATLEELGVPLLYLGDLFERKEIRDLLSLLALDAEYGGIGLVRVAALPEYSVSRQDSLTLLRWAEANKVPVIEALDRVSEIEQLGNGGRAGLAKLGVHLRGLGKVSPWTMLTTWLFERSGYLQSILADSGASAQQQRVAIYQLLKVCGEYIMIGGGNRRRFLERIRRIESLNEDTVYRAISSEATDMDAVRVMTIHGSKGLEFPAVHLPGIATSYMPANWRGVRIDPPAGLERLAMQKSGHEAEEECLFFVALSRARDFLSLTRAERYTAGRGASASRFLKSVGGVSSHQRPASGRSFSGESALKPPAVRQSYSERELEIYLQCPAKYRYEIVEALRGGPGKSGYVRFHRCVYKTIGWLEAERAQGRIVSGAQAQAHLSALWASNGPVKHHFESYYRNAAEDMVQRMVNAIGTETGQYDRQEWTVPVGSRSVTITPDRVVLDRAGVVRVQRVRTGRKTKSEPGKPVYALLRRGASVKYPGRRISVETFYLGTGEHVAVPEENDEELLSTYSGAIADIEHGDFHAKPDTRRCANCPCYFICGS